jgi:hypothetical protein
MGLLDPAPPPFEIEEWRRLPHLERIKPLAQDWALNGFGTPPVVYLLYVVKIVVYALGGLLLISATSDGLGGLGNLGSWWTEPIVFQKAVIWTMLWEVLGLGAGSLPLTSASARWSAASSTGCGRGRPDCRPGPTACR